MPIVTDVRTRTDVVIEQTKTTLSSMQQGFSSLTGDARERATSTVDDGKGLAAGAVSLARKQAFVSLGASDAVLAAATKRGAELPGDVRTNATQLVDTAMAGINRVTDFAGYLQDRAAELAGGLKVRGADAVQTARTLPLSAVTAINDAGARVNQLRDAVDKLADRGETVATDLRHDPVLVRLIGDVDNTVEKAADQVTSVAQKLRSRAAVQAEQEAAAATATPVRLTPATQVPTHKTTVRKTPAGQAPISTTPTHRAAAEETAIRKAAAAKAAKTRKIAAVEAAAKREAAAAKAAATRKEAAQARAHATEVRKAAAAKAAETRKANNAARNQAADKRSAAAVKAAQTRKVNTAT